MSRELHATIVHLLTTAHDHALSIAQRVEALSAASELLLYREDATELVDEFCETFLSLHIDQNPVIRRFAAYFMEALCNHRSVYACRCLIAIARLLQDSDSEVVAMSLMACRTIYRRALYWISAQQKDENLSNIAVENVKKLESLLGRMVEHLQGSCGTIFQLGCKAAESVILSQSISGLHPRAQAYLETSGCTCLEDLRLPEQGALDYERLQVQANKLLEYLCSILVEHKLTTPLMKDCESLCRILANVAYHREEYTHAVILSFQSLADEVHDKVSLKCTLRAALKKILSSRNAIKFHPTISGLIGRLNETSSSSLDVAVFQAELERVKGRLSSVFPGDSGREERNDDEGGVGLVDEEHAVSVFWLRAQNSGEMAKLALSLLARLPNLGGSASTKICRQVSGVEPSINRFSLDSFEISPPLGSETKDDLPSRLVAIKRRRLFSSIPPGTNISPESILDFSSSGDGFWFPSALGSSFKDLKSNILSHNLADIILSDSTGTTKNLLLAALATSDYQRIADILLVAYGDLRTGIYGHLVAFVFDNCPMNIEVLRGIRQTVISVLPRVTVEVVRYFHRVVVEGDVSSRRAALAALAGVILSKVNVRVEAFLTLIQFCFSSDDSTRADAVRLVSLRLYMPGMVSFIDYIPKPSLADMRSKGIPFYAIEGLTGLDVGSTTIAQHTGTDIPTLCIDWSNVEARVRPHLIAVLCQRNMLLLPNVTAVMGKINNDKLNIISAFARSFMDGITEATLSELCEMIAVDGQFSIDILSSLVKEVTHVTDCEAKFRFIAIAADRLVEAEMFPNLINVVRYLPKGTVRFVLFKLLSTPNMDGHEIDAAVHGLISTDGSDVLFLSGAIEDIIRLSRTQSLLAGVMTATNKLLAMKSSFDSEKIFRVVLLNLVEDSDLPAAFLRFVIQVLQTCPGVGFETFVATQVVPKLCKPSVVDDPMHWRGLSMVLTLLLTCQDVAARQSACEAICSLTPSRVAELVTRKKELRNVLRDFLVHQPVTIYAEIRRALLE